ncbi:hypothetical protein V7S43_017137 [Phytophthora oleae]|uniref:Uncharacterized protein n=1 Tax=Phytophthora oleae TaxID=2107226 RepID=A0ABD3EUS6_9STRA
MSYQQASSPRNSTQRKGTDSCFRQCIRDQSHYDQGPTDDGPKRTLAVEYWERTDECLERKWAHMEMVDELYEAREDLILATTLNNEETVLEPNMFPYKTPKGIEHWTLWSRYELDDADVEEFVCRWLRENAPQVESWNYDENLSRSIDVFHVHVYLKGPTEQGYKHGGMEK